MRAVHLFFVVDSGCSWIERFNGFWTPACLLILSIVSFVLPLVTPPVLCWTPAEMTNAMVAYISYKCWQNNIVAYGDDPFLGEKFVADSESGIEGTRLLYQWLPLILFIQALFFALPYIILCTTVSCAGMNMNKIRGMAEGYSKLSTADKQSMSKQLAQYLNQWMESNPLKGLPWGLLTIITIFVKLLFLVNISTQYTLFDNFIKSENETSYGAQIFKNLKNDNGSEWMDSPAFPKSIRCFFNIRQIQNIQAWEMQCNVHMNLYYEIISSVVWAWLCLTLVATVTSFVCHGVNIIIPVFRTRFVRRHLLASSSLERQPTELEISRFAGTTLGQDGVTVLRWISKVSSDLLVVETIDNLWKIHHGGFDSVQQAVTQQPTTLQPTCPPAQYYAVAQPPQTLPPYYPAGPHGDENIPLMARPGTQNMYPKTT